MFSIVVPPAKLFATPQESELPLRAINPVTYLRLEHFAPAPPNARGRPEARPLFIRDQGRGDTRQEPIAAVSLVSRVGAAFVTIVAMLRRVAPGSRARSREVASVRLEGLLSAAQALVWLCSYATNANTVTVASTPR